MKNQAAFLAHVYNYISIYTLISRLYTFNECFIGDWKTPIRGVYQILYQHF